MYVFLRPSLSGMQPRVILLRSGITSYIRMLPVVTSRRIYHTFSFQGIMGHRFSVFSPSSSRQRKCINISALQIRPLAVSYERSPYAAEIHGARHKTFLAWFLPSIMYSAKEGLDRIVSRQTQVLDTY